MTPSPDTSITSPPAGHIDAGFLVWLVLVGGVIYLLPTIIAISRHRPSAGLVMILNLFTGWSLLGWALAFWLATLPDDPPTLAHPQLAPRQPAAPILSPDGRYWWDGYEWRLLPPRPQSPTP